MKKIKEYCKNNKVFVIVMAIGLILFFLQITQVIMYADDYSLATIAKRSGIAGAWDYFKDNYMNWGGGWTGFNVICIFMIGMKAWYLIELAVIFLTILLAIKLGGYKTDKEKAICTFVVWMLYFILTVDIARETILWVDGSMAYVFTTFLLVLYIYLLFSRVNNEKSRKKYDYALLPIVSLFAGWSTAQPGAVAVMISIIILGFAKIINKKKIPVFYYICAFLCAVGYAIFYFSPGNAARMAEQAAEFSSLGVLSRMAYKSEIVFESLFDFINCPFNGIPFYLFLAMILLTMISLFHIKKENNKIVKYLLLGSCIYSILFLMSVLYIRLDLPNSSTLSKLFVYKDIYVARCLGTFKYTYLISYMYASLGMLCMIGQALYISIKRKESIAFVLVSASFASQLAMLLAPTHPNRTLYITVGLFIVTISVLVKHLMEYKINWRYAIASILILYDIKIGFFILMLYFVSTFALNYFELDKHKYDTVIVLFAFFMVAMSNYFVITTKYAENKSIYIKNVIEIEGYIAEPNEEKVILFERYNGDLYGFTPIVGMYWIETDAKEYFGLESDVVFMYEDEYIALKNKEIESEIN